MTKRFSIEEVKEKIIDLGYIPLFNSYKNTFEKLSIQTKEGYILEAILSNLMSGHISRIVQSSNKHSINNIKLWLKLNNKSFELLTDKFDKTNKHLQWKCSNDNCKETFWADWNNISHNQGCPYCVGHKVGLSNCLATKYPKLICEWNFVKNNSLTPYNVTYGAKQKVWWIC